jgi:hypothetical protein
MVKINQAFDKIKDDFSNASNSELEAKKEREELELDKDHQIGEKKVVHKVVKIGIWVLFSLGFTLVVVKLYHLVMPSYFFWLSSEQIDELDRFITSGLLGGILGRGLNAIFKRK